MAGVTADMFAEETDVGGLPPFAYAIRNCLPANKKKRDSAYRIQMVILTYFIYSLFNMARRPIAVVKTKIVEECNATNASGQSNSSNQWCQEMFFESTTEEFMGFLDSMYIASYGIVLYVSGIVADCYNPRYYLTTGCFLAGFFCALLGMSDYWEIRSFKFFTMAQILFGASQSTGWPVALSCVTHWYSGDRRGMFFGFWNTHNYVGSVLGIYIAGNFVDQNWGWSFFIPGFILLSMGLVVFLCMVADPKDLKKLDVVKSSSSAVRAPRRPDAPQWLSSNRSIKMYDALSLPGVVEFSACMFFSRMVGYIYLFWLPTFIRKTAPGMTASTAAYYSIAYVMGGSLGGIFAGILVDIFRKSALVCAFFLLVSVPVLLLGQLSKIGENMLIDFPVYILLGLFIEAPYVVTSTSVSADLGTHKMIKRNHRAISTIGGIVEGTGALGAAIGTYMCGYLFFRTAWVNIVYAMMALQLMATLCLSKQAYTEFSRKGDKRASMKEYWRTPKLF